MRGARQFEERAGEDLLHRRELLRRGIALAGVSGSAAVGLNAIGGVAAAQAGGQGLMDAKGASEKDRVRPNRNWRQSPVDFGLPADATIMEPPRSAALAKVRNDTR